MADINQSKELEPGYEFDEKSKLLLPRDFTKELAYKEVIDSMANSIDDMVKSYSDVVESLRDVTNSNRITQNSFRNLLNEAKKIEPNVATQVKAYKNLSNEQLAAVESSNSLVQGFELNSKKLSKQFSENESLLRNLNSELEALKDTPGLENTVKEFEKLIEHLNETQKELKAYQELINNTPQFRFADNLEKFTKDIPVIGKLLSNITEPFKEGMIEAIKDPTKQVDALAAGLANVKKVGLQALFTLIVEEAFKVNQQITELQRNFGLNNVQAIKLRSELTLMAITSGDVFINSQKLLESFNAISGELGFQVKASGQMLETYTNLTKRMGFNNSEATQLSVLTGLQSENTNQVLNNTIKTINASRNSNKLFNNTKLILQDIAGASAATIVSLGKSPDLLAKAATKARELGLNLSQVERIADSLLNFESSIEAELTAELITGKQLNLERARFLALTNDLSGLQDEIAKQGLNFADYTEISRIGQQALAETLGMSREEMSQMLFNQEKQELAQRKSRGELDKQTLAQFNSLSAQEKLNESLSKFKDIAVAVVTVISPILDIFAFIAEKISESQKGMIALITAIGTYYGLSKAVALVESLKLGRLTAQAVAQTTITALTGVGLFKVGAALAAAAGMYTYLNSIEPKAMGGPISSGKPYLVGEEGPELIIPNSSGYVVNNNDLRKMGENNVLMKEQPSIIEKIEDSSILNKNVPSSPPFFNIQPLIDEIKMLRQEVKQYQSIPIVVENNIDGDLLGRGIRRGISRGTSTVPSVYT
jgi:DNA-binding transcriptional regulator GbsR (MarR family)